MNAISQKTSEVPTSPIHPNLIFGTMMTMFRAMTGAYALSVLGFMVLRVTVGESAGLVALFNAFLHLLILPALVLLPICALMRRWELAAMLLPIVVAFGLWYGGDFLPKSATIAGDAQTLRVMTFNLADRRSDETAIVRVIEQSGADVVALQELEAGTAAYLSAALREQYPEQALHPFGGFVGQGILSRYPIVEDTFIRTTLGQQTTTIDFNGQPIHIHNAHAAYPFMDSGFALRGQDVNYHLNNLDSTTPTILLGDFNLTDRAEDYHRITETLTDAHRIAGRGFGFTYRAYPLFGLPAARIDYVFHNDHFQAIEAYVIADDTGSDHLPVVVALVLN